VKAKKLMGYHHDGLSTVFVKVTVMALSLSQTLRDLDEIPSLIESIRLRSNESRWCSQAEEWASKATLALETLAIKFEDEKSEETYKEPEVFRCLKLLDTHLEFLMGSEDLQKLFMGDLDNPEMVILLLSFDLPCLRIDPSANDNYVFRHASSNGNVEVVERLLADRDASGRLRVDPSANKNEAICNASRFGHLAVVDRLLSHRDASGRLSVDPSARNNEAIRHASINGHVAVVERLLLDPRVDPSAYANSAIRWASYYGHVAVVDRLLSHRDASGRLSVDPSAGDNQAVKWASEGGHLAVVERLLQDSRVDPLPKIMRQSDMLLEMAM